MKFSHNTLALTATALAFSGAAMFGISNSAYAQQAQGNKPFVSGWFKTCSESEPKVCDVQYKILAPNRAPLLALHLVEVQGDAKRRVFRIALPTGRSLPQGVQVQIDDRKASQFPYAYCRPQGCVAEIGLNDDLIKIFKKSKGVNVVSINFQGKVEAFPVTLTGFTKVYDGEPVKIPTAEERQKKLEEQLQKKAQEKLQQQGD